MLRRSSIQRTPFKPRSSETRFSSFSQVKGKGKKAKALRAFKPLNRNGRRTQEWRRVWRFLKPRLEAAGRTKCEFHFIPHHCFGGLTPAHSKKRRMMQGDDIYAVAICCSNFHRELDEQMSHAEMEAAVMKAIERGGGMILPDKLKEKTRD